MQNIVLKMTPDEMTINLDMFGVLMKNIIVTNLYGTPLVTMNRRTSRLRGTHVKQKPG
jgi:hypothetical protein